MPNLPNMLAGGGPVGSWEPVHLFSGDADVHTDGAVCAEDLAIYTVVAFNGDGELVALVPDATDGTEVAAGIMAQAGVSGQKAPYYTAGQFNPDALVWPAATATFEARQAAFRRSTIIIKAVI